MATKFGKVSTYYKEIQTIKSHNPLNTWSCEVYGHYHNTYSYQTWPGGKW